MIATTFNTITLIITTVYNNIACKVKQQFTYLKGIWTRPSWRECFGKTIRIGIAIRLGCLKF